MCNQFMNKGSRTTLTLTNILLRWCLGAWILYCFIMGASYSGSVRAFLILPMPTEPIKNLIDILNSGFSVGYTYTGEEASILLSHFSVNSTVFDVQEDKLFEDSKDPVMMELWKKKETVESGVQFNRPLEFKA